MQVTFRTNLGRIDADRLGIKHWDKCLKGAKVNVSDEAAEVLAKHKIVEPLEVRGVSPATELRGIGKADK